MCLVLFAYDPDSAYPLVVAANRDEFYARATRSAHFWDDRPELLAGRDLEAGGTWLGVSRPARFAAVTNFAEEGASDAPLSRGRLPETFLAGEQSARDFANRISGAEYRGFNLLLWDGNQLVYTSNRGHGEALDAGVYGLANAELGARWPKVERGRRELESLLARNVEPEPLIELLSDRTLPPDEQLPRRGRPLELERRVAPCFIAGDDYGTRASTAVIFQRRGAAGLTVRFIEQEYGPGGSRHNRSEFRLELGD